MQCHWERLRQWLVLTDAASPSSMSAMQYESNATERETSPAAATAAVAAPPGAQMCCRTAVGEASFGAGTECCSSMRVTGGDSADRGIWMAASAAVRAASLHAMIHVAQYFKVV